jgi:hypothetical protein
VVLGDHQLGLFGGRTRAEHRDTCFVFQLHKTLPVRDGGLLNGFWSPSVAVPPSSVSPMAMVMNTGSIMVGVITTGSNVHGSD